MKQRQLKYPLAVLSGLGLCIAGAIAFPIVDWLLGLVDYIRQLGTNGLVLFGLLYFFAGLVMMPMLPIGILAGMVFGFWQSYVVLLPLAALSASVATLLGRHAFRELVMAFVSSRPAWRAVRRSLSNQGVKAVALNRMAPLLPFGLQNYALGAIGVTVRQQFLGTVIGMQPALCVALYIGSLSSTLAEARATIGASMLSGPRLYLLVAGGVAMIIFAVWIAQTARRSIEEAREHTETVES
ncbi:MAG: TVP38/TMEM64 family protein [Bradymonadia bacterium]